MHVFWEWWRASGQQFDHNSGLKHSIKREKGDHVC